MDQYYRYSRVIDADLNSGIRINFLKPQIINEEPLEVKNIRDGTPYGLRNQQNYAYG